MSQQLEIDNSNSVNINEKESSICCKCWQWKRIIILFLLFGVILIIVFGSLLYVSFHSNETVELDLMVAYGCAFIAGIALMFFMCGCLCKNKVHHSSIQPV